MSHSVRTNYIHIYRDEKKEKEFEVEADLVIGADGAHSALRRSMLQRPMTNFSQTYIEHGYVELCVPPTQDGQVRLCHSQPIKLSLRTLESNQE